MSAPLPFRGHSIQALCEKDLLVSFYDSEEDRTLTLLRTPVYEPLLPPEERGVRCTLAGKELGYLAGAAWDARGVRLRMRDGRAVEVEAHRADQASLQRSMLVMELMNFDGSLELTGITATDEIRVDMLLQRLDSEDPSTVRSALREAHAAREMMTEPMLEIVTGLEPALEDDDNLPSLAFYLLASWREPRGLEPLVQFLEKYGEDAVEELGDVVLQDGPRLLAAMACGNFAPVRRLVEYPGASVWARIAAMTSLTIAAASGEIAASEVETYLESLATRGILGTNVGLWSELAAQAADLGSSRLLPLAEQAWENDLIDPSMIGLDEIRADVARGQEAMLAKLRKHLPLDHVLDPVAMTSWWSFFRPELSPRRRSSSDEDEPDQSDFMSAYDDVIVPVRTGPKIGRNEPCPCGSGKKYKKCCGA